MQIRGIWKTVQKWIRKSLVDIDPESDAYPDPENDVDPDPVSDTDPFLIPAFSKTEKN
jgi:hypothetical protein